MADPEYGFDRRGAEPPLTIDREPRARPRRPAPVALIVSLLLLIVVAGAVVYMYRTGVRAPDGPPEPLGAPLGDVRAPAPAQPRATDPGAGLTISRDDPNAAGANPTLAPPPEQPLPPQSSAPPAAAPRDATPTNTVIAPPAAARAEKPAQTIDSLVAGAAAADKAKTAPPADGVFVVQIGAFSSETVADREWNKAAAVAPGDMAGKGKRVVQVPTDAGTLYRTSITGFGRRDQAAALCAKLEAAGGSCFVK